MLDPFGWPSSVSIGGIRGFCQWSVASGQWQVAFVMFLASMVRRGKVDNFRTIALNQWSARRRK